MRFSFFLLSLLLLCVFATSTNPQGGFVAPRSRAPQFSATAVINEKFEKISLNEYLDQGKWTVLLFYPADFTFVCPTEIISFSDHAQEFSTLNTQVLAISTDSQHTHLAWVRTPRKEGGLGKINIPLVSDVAKTISRSYGVLVEDDTDELFGLALRGVFVIDPRGKIRSMTINDEQVGRSVEETLRLVQGFQHADENGVGCPASWHPGDATIKPHPDESKEFFRAFAEKKEL